ncbi:hypothetical protein [Rhodanobacter koreensis]
MADIPSIDGYINPWRSSTNRSPSQDFADELAKEANTAPADTQTHAQKGSDTPSAARAQEEQGGKATTERQTQDGVVAELATPAGQQLSGRSLPGNNSVLSLEAALLNAQQQLGTVVQPIGVTEALLGSRIFGMHLLAGGYLSELALSQGATADIAFDAVNAVQSSAAPQEGQAMPVSSARSLQSTSLEEQSSIEALVMQTAPVANEASEAATETLTYAAVATASTSAPLSQWLERSLRFTKQSDGSTTAWLRDYRVGAAEAANLRDSVLQEANAKGVVLGKIMLNGREVWTSRSDT